MGLWVGAPRVYGTVLVFCEVSGNSSFVPFQLPEISGFLKR